VLTDLEISGFRTFRELRVPRLARVNLFVGTNNAGKTSLLEAVELLADGGLMALRRGIARRGERLQAKRSTEDDVDERGVQLDPSHLFHGHRLRPGVRFALSGGNSPPLQGFCDLVEVEANGSEGIGQVSLPGLEERPLAFALRFESHLSPEARLMRISARGGIPTGLSFYGFAESPRQVRFVTTGSIGSARTGLLWDLVALTPEEECVLASLRLIEPRIERIAFLGEGLRVSRNFFLKMEGSEERLPLGSLGDGLKRLLTLTLHLVAAGGGFLLVDEIDTGLHYSVMADMWQLVIQTARRLDVQVFATTHSLDCVHALAWVRQQNPEAASEVLLHRVDREATETMTYTPDEIVVAARNHLEVR